MLLEGRSHKERQGKFTAPVEQNSMAYLQQQQIEQQSADQIAEFLAAVFAAAESCAQTEQLSFRSKSTTSQKRRYKLTAARPAAEPVLVGYRSCS